MGICLTESEEVVGTLIPGIPHVCFLFERSTSDEERRLPHRLLHPASPKAIDCTTRPTGVRAPIALRFVQDTCVLSVVKIG